MLYIALAGQAQIYSVDLDPKNICGNCLDKDPQMILYSFPHTILLGMNCRIRCIHTLLQCYITKRFTVIFRIWFLSAIDSTAKPN